MGFFIGKDFRKDVLTSRINVKHANNHNILYHLQRGFREGRSCKTQPVELVHNLADNMQGGGADRRTGDMMDFKGKTNHWIEAFLSNRTQRVVINGDHSYDTRVKSGVPQGSVLGPCLFLLYNVHK